MLIVHDLFDLNLLASLCYFSLGLNATGEFCHVGRHLARAITILPGAVAADDYSFAWHFAGGPNIPKRQGAEAGLECSRVWPQRLLI